MSTAKKRVTWSTDREPRNERSQRKYRSRSSGRTSRSPDKSRKCPSRSSETSRSSWRRRSRSPEWRNSRRSRSPEWRSSRQSRSRSPERRCSRQSRSPERRNWRRSRTSTYDNYSSFYQSEGNYRRSKDTDLTYQISKIVDKKLERTDAMNPSSMYYHRRQFSPGFRHSSMNQPIYPCSAFITCGCSFLNSYRRSCVACQSWNSESRSPAAAAAFSNPQIQCHAASTSHSNAYSGDNSIQSKSRTSTRNNLKSVIVKQKIQKLLKRVSANSDEELSSRSKELASSKTIVNKVSVTSNASASLSTCDESATSKTETHSSADNSAASKAKTLNKFLIGNEMIVDQSTSNKSAQKDQNYYSFAEDDDDDDDLIFLAFVDKNDLKKDVEVIVISDDENEEKEDDENKEDEDAGNYEDLDLEEYAGVKLEDISSDEDDDHNGKITSLCDLDSRLKIESLVLKKE